MSDLPTGWARARVVDLVGSGGVFTDGDWVESKDQDPGGDVRLTQLADVGDGVWRDRSDRFMTSSKAADLGCTYLEAGDVLVARMPEPLGRACLFPGSATPCVTVVDVAVLRPGPLAVNPSWLMHALNSPHVRSAVLALQAGTTRKRISRRNLAQVELLVPPLAEQSRVVNELERRLSHVDAAVRGLTAVRRRTSAARAQIVSHLTAPVAVRDGPAGWRTVPMRELLSEPLRNGRSAPTASGGGGIRTFTITAVTRRDFSATNTKFAVGSPDQVAGLWAEPGDVFVQRSNTPELVGSAALYTGPGMFAIYPDLLIRIRADQTQVLPAWLDLVLRSQHSRRYLRSVAQGLAGSMPKISQPKIEALLVPLPPLDQQHRLVTEADRRMSLIDAAERTIEGSLAKAGQLRRALLAAAFSGHLVPQDPDDEPASVLIERISAARAAAAPTKSTRRTKKDVPA